MAKISGILTDPIGQPMTNCTIELKSQRSTANVLRTVTSNFDTSDAGAYMMDVYSGIYDVVLKCENKAPQLIGTITVFDNSDDGSLNDFLILSNPTEFNSGLIDSFKLLNAETKQTAESIKNAIEECYSVLNSMNTNNELVDNQFNSLIGKLQNSEMRVDQLSETVSQFEVKLEDSVTLIEEHVNQANLSATDAQQSAKDSKASADLWYKRPVFPPSSATGIGAVAWAAPKEAGKYTSNTPLYPNQKIGGALLMVYRFTNNADGELRFVDENRLTLTGTWQALGSAYKNEDGSSAPCLFMRVS